VVPLSDKQVSAVEDVGIDFSSRACILGICIETGIKPGVGAGLEASWSLKDTLSPVLVRLALALPLSLLLRLARELDRAGRVVTLDTLAFLFAGACCASDTSVVSGPGRF
jgi:hypothetical protein